MSSNKPILYAELTYGDTTVKFSGTRISSGAYITDEGITGWYSTPDAKWSLTERSYSDGAFSVEDDYIIYSTRTITASIGVVAPNRSTLLDTWGQILACAHHECKFRVVDADSDTYVYGYPTVESEATWDSRYNEGTLTIVCPDPRRLSTTYDSCVLDPSNTSIGGGLFYGDDAAGLVYDLSYGDIETESTNTGTVNNNGSATSYPVVSVYGPFDDGFSLRMRTGGELYVVAYSEIVTGVPVVLDYHTRQITCGGADRSRYLTSRGFAGIAPGNSATFNFLAVGSGYAYVEIHDTYV